MIDSAKLHAGVCAGLTECAETLGYGDLVIGEVREHAPRDQCGAYISLVGDGGSIELGVVTDHHGCHRLAAVMLGLEEDDDPVPDDELGDAMGELLNILAGTVKTRLHEHGVAVRLGLPMFCRGTVEVGKGSERDVFDVRIGDVDTVCVVHQVRAAEAAA